MKMDFREIELCVIDSIYLAQDRDQCRALANTFGKMLGNY
jgi:hypothetical protein